MYTPELKVKRLLDALAYYILLGHTDDIETDYRRVMHAKREVPVSSCPDHFENMIYSTGEGTSKGYDNDEYERFSLLLEKLDAKAQKYEVPKKRRPKIESKQHKRRRIGITDGEWLTVNTDNMFRYGDDVYVIEDQEAQYAPISTEYGDYYAMDRILASGGKFYDMNYDEVKVQKIGTVVAKEISGR